MTLRQPLQRRTRIPRWLGLTTGALLLACVTAPALGQSSPKRGIAGGGYELANALNASWYYHWSNDPNGTSNHAPILGGAMHGQYTPMIGGGTTGNIQNKINRILGYKDSLNVEYVLGFNEPERPDQADLTVAEAIAMWDIMDAQLADGAGLKLVSPAVSDNLAGRDWLADFMTQADANNYQVDAIAFHWYGSVNLNNPAGSANNFLNRVDSYWNTYGLPVWITEFAGMDFGNDQYTSPDLIAFNKAFLDIVIPGLESRSYVERYAWWQFGQNDNGEQDDTRLIQEANGVWTPTTIGDTYVPSLMPGETQDLNGVSPGMDTFYLRGGRLANNNTSSPVSVYQIDAVEGDSEISTTAGAQLVVADGIVRVRSGASLRKIFAGSASFVDSLILNEGEIRISGGELELAGGLSFGGVDSGDYIVENNGTLRITGNVNAMANAITVLSGGALRMESADASTMGSAIEVQPGGTLRIGAVDSETDVFPDLPTSFVNNGTVRVFDAETIRGMTGNGVLFAEEELVRVFSNPGFDGEIGVRDGAMLRPSDADGFGTTTGKTIVYGDQQTGVLELINGIVTHAEPLELRARQQGAVNMPHLVNLASNNTFAGPITLAVSGSTWNIQSNAGLLTLSGGIVASPDTLSRTLRLTGEGDGVFTAPITMNPGAENTLIKVGGGTWAFNANVTGFDTARIVGGTLEVNATLEVPTLTVRSGTTLSGNGQVVGSVVVESGGTVDPSGLGNRSLAIIEDLTFETGSTLSLGLSSNQLPGILYDQVLIVGELSIQSGASFELVLLDGYTPAQGDSFFLMSWGTRSGMFDTVALPTLDPALAWDISAFETNGALGVILAVTPGDADGDGDIDDSDLGTSFANYTGPVGAAGNKTAAQGDTDGDGDVDDSDLGTSFAAYTGPLSPSSVPEPASLALLALGGLFAHRRRG